MKAHLFPDLAKLGRLSFLFMLFSLVGAAVPCWGGNPTLSISPSLTLVPAKQGGSGTDVITIQAGGSFRGNVALAVSGLPSSVAASWSSPAIALSSGSGSSTLTIAPSAATPVNWYSFTVTASGDGVSVSRSYNLQVRPAQAVQIALTAPALTVWHGQGSNITVSLAPLHAAILSNPSIQVASGLPAGVTAWWEDPTSVNGVSGWNLHVQAGAAVAAGTYQVLISAQATDSLSGLVYTSTQQFPLLVSLVVAANVSIGGTPGAAISPTFMGLSHEWWEPAYIMGQDATGANPIYRQLLNNLTAYGAGPINLRIGGVSTDSSGEPTSATVPPMADLAAALGAKFDLGVNLGADNVALAVSQAEAYVSQMPAGSVDAIEIGNEPDLYSSNGYRPPTYTVAEYLADFETWKNNIVPVLPAGVKLMGPSWASIGMRGNLPVFLSENSGSLAIVSQHNGVTIPSADPADDILLTPAAATSGPAGAAPEAAAAHGYNLPFRMGELCSAADGGIPGISNAFGAALWEIDTMFEYAHAGVDGVNWSASIGDYNNPFIFSTTTAKGKTTFSLSAVTPAYYGMLFFQAATANGAKLLPANIITAANMKVWATVDNAGTPRVVVINKETKMNNISISMPGYTRASVLRLEAPSYTSTSGVTFAGQTFDGSLDGTIQGTQAIETVEATNGLFELWLDATSADLLIFSN